MAWHREDRPSCPSDVVVMARVGYGCETCGWTAEDGEGLIVAQEADWAESAERLDTFMAEHDRIVAENKRFRDALERIANEPAPGYTLSCRNIARAALAGSRESTS